MFYPGKTQVNPSFTHLGIYLFTNPEDQALTGTFKLETLPPTSAAAKYHSLRAYHTVQQWLGNKLAATQYGFELCDGVLVPIRSDLAPAPSLVLNLVSCGCKAGCSSNCKCKKEGQTCSAICSHCLGETCTNSAMPHTNEWHYIQAILVINQTFYVPSCTRWQCILHAVSALKLYSHNINISLIDF